MSIYERFGVKPNINVSEFSTRYGGALMRRAAVEAMDEAAKESVETCWVCFVLSPLEGELPVVI